jgi:hypothetical protein
VQLRCDLDYKIMTGMRPSEKRLHRPLNVYEPGLGKTPPSRRSGMSRLERGDGLLFGIVYLENGGELGDGQDIPEPLAQAG